jgi:hypothetical protein
MTDLIAQLTVDQVRSLLQQAGYRVAADRDANGGAILRSATAAIPFEVRFGTRLPGDLEVYGDFTVLAALRVAGELPGGLVDRWNNTKRFGRLHVLEDLLILDMDVAVLGGVSADHLRFQIELWDRVVQELLPFVRDAARAAPPANGAGYGTPVLETAVERTDLAG